MPTTFAAKILDWYREHRRDLPWRGIGDFYRIWISEIILQQTRVAQGYAYYQRFIEAFPNVEALAQASPDEVMRLWQGLGYYSRARNLHAAAQQIINAGHFPADYASVRQLKGVGDYTAAAICSFAYNQPCAVVDGNVYRVLSRYFGICEPIDTARGKKVFMQLAEQLLPTKQSADYNQALMDFGAMQCVPHQPDCLGCVLSSSCSALEKHLVSQLPMKKHRIKQTERFFIYICVRTPQGIWLHKRTADDIWRGLYEVPMIEAKSNLTFEQIKSQSLCQMLPSGGTWQLLQSGLKHVLTHRIIHADAYSLTYPDCQLPHADYEVVPYESLADYAMPRLVQHIVHMLDISPHPFLKKD